MSRLRVLFGRDTDLDWERLGEQQPYWGVLTSPEFAGAARLDPDAQAQFFSTGEAYVAHVRERLEAWTGAPSTIGGALDFGCGVGRLLIPIRRRAAWAVGVDVAASMRAVCARHLADAGCLDTPVVSSIEEAIAAAPAPFDWVNSYIVLQHVPPARGYRLIAALARALAPGGALSVQIIAFSDPQHARPSPWRHPIRTLLWSVQRRSMPEGTVSVYDYDLARVMAILAQEGVGSVLLEHEDHGGHHGFIIYARKTG